MPAPRASAGRPGGGWSRDRRSGRRRLFGRGLLWGLAVGASTGGLTGVLVAVVAAAVDEGLLSILVLAPLGALYGVVLGALVSVIPSVLGALVIASVIPWRHPHPAGEDAVARDLGLLFVTVVAVLDGAIFVGFVLSGQGLSSIVPSLPFLALGNGWVALVLRRAGTSLTRVWLEAGR
ncbi:MAG: hypothetical protein QOH36_487 [Actinomycetota bacterium]|jgi:hypothetical protein|nr:hypothetical protein [Actinomycetota bacterium]MEA2974101.1 hypothetical protein [Actinomycetota bacterium]